MNQEIKIPENDFLVSKTDLKGNITYCNRSFINISGYGESELLYKPHNIIRHKDMPRTVFRLLWREVKQKKEVFAYVKNRTKNDDYYWVYTNITASLDESGNIVGYHSVRRKPNDKAIKNIEELYTILLQKEASNGVNATLEYLEDMLKTKQVEYNEFIINLQHEVKA